MGIFDSSTWLGGLGGGFGNGLQGGLFGGAPFGAGGGSPFGGGGFPNPFGGGFGGGGGFPSPFGASPFGGGGQWGGGFPPSLFGGGGGGFPQMPLGGGGGGFPQMPFGGGGFPSSPFGGGFPPSPFGNSGGGFQGWNGFNFPSLFGDPQQGPNRSEQPSSDMRAQRPQWEGAQAPQAPTGPRPPPNIGRVSVQGQRTEGYVPQGGGAPNQGLGATRWSGGVGTGPLGQRQQSNVGGGKGWQNIPLPTLNPMQPPDPSRKQFG